MTYPIWMSVKPARSGARNYGQGPRPPIGPMIQPPPIGTRRLRTEQATLLAEAQVETPEFAY